MDNEYCILRIDTFVVAIQHNHIESSEMTAKQ